MDNKQKFIHLNKHCCILASSIVAYFIPAGQECHVRVEYGVGRTTDVIYDTEEEAKAFFDHIDRQMKEITE